MDVIKESLQEIAESSKDTESLLDELDKEEKLAFEAIASAPVPNFILEGLNWDKEDAEQIMRGSSICRTAELPSQTRYLGYGSNSNKTGGPAIYGKETYDIGIPVQRNVDDTGKAVIYTFPNVTEPPPPGQFTLLYLIDVHKDRNRCGDGLVMPDYIDFYYAPLKDGKASITFPNEKEKAAYGYSREKFKGMLAIVFPVFTQNLGSAKKSDFNAGDFGSEKVSVTVNSKPVTGFKSEGHILFFQGEGDSFHWEPSDNDDYTIEVSVPDELAWKNFRIDGLLLY